jgi:polyferredoxin
MKAKLITLLSFSLFIVIGLTLCLTQGKVFYLLNFAYIGLFVSIGVFLMMCKKPYARNVAQIGVGLYMLIYLGVMLGENMQITGFWYYLFLGVFEAAVIHYLVAKIAGPLLFGRGWCGYACWTAAVLDLLPYKTPKDERKNIGFIRYIVFALSLGFVASLFLLRSPNIEGIIYIAFIIGNILYYAVGIALAFAFRDNRAFCKYICPITVFLKPASYFSLLRVKVNEEACIGCKKCEKVCPMNVAITDNRRSRKNGTECILCLECTKVCPADAIKLNSKMQFLGNIINN